jgi:hypothetical protein
MKTKTARPTRLCVDEVKARDVEKVIKKVRETFPRASRNFTITFYVPTDFKSVMKHVIHWDLMARVDSD